MHYVVVDLEMCKVKKASRTEKYPYSMETIQIGAVLLNSDFEMTDQLSLFVAPQYGAIDSFIAGLTGISNEQVEGAPSFAEAVHIFESWIPDDSIIVSWSMTDRDQLQKEFAAKDIHSTKIERMFDSWMDAQRIFGELIDVNRPYKLSEALNIANIFPEGNEHDGLFDAINTAELFAKMETSGIENFNSEYRRGHDTEVKSLGFSLGSLFEAFDWAVA